MKETKRSLIIVVLAWVTSLFLVSLVGAYYYTEFQKEKSANTVYVNMYNNLLKNYTSLLQSYTKLLNDYNSLAQSYEAERHNLTYWLQQYETEKQNLTSLLQQYESCIMRVNICIDYGNGTVLWHNQTIVPLGCNLLQATRMVAVVNSTYWPAYRASFVDAINGVWNKGAYYWMWYYWDKDSKTWKYGNCGADLYVLSDGETVRWRYEIPNYP